MEYLQFEFETTSEDRNEILLAMLSDIGFESFLEENNQLLAYIREPDFNAHALKDILNILKIKYSVRSIPHQNWNAAWESSFEPVVVNNFAAIRASFHPPVTNVKFELIITPKMSFGTGHHATTWLMIEQMSKLDFTGKSVVDFGTGTAVLAILAEKMGALEITAIDNDDWSIKNAIENCAANHCTRIKIEKRETFFSPEKPDIILANINLNVILENITEMVYSLKPAGMMLLSGFLADDALKMEEKLASAGFECNLQIQKNSWICILASPKI
jgi:ribosomal protein L11 methyltransferase